ncbi:complement C1q-like protein 4 [Mytilus edulis]|uniref:complement C1q-like protein 4 n=1 Tax=Mytilus edulis TaxID=6550 RepID=UPI0039EF7672
MKGVVSIVVMIVIMQIGQILSVCKKDNSLSEDLLDMLCKCRKHGFTRKTLPAFSVSLTTHKALAAGEVIKFDKIRLNTGNIYNPATGIFTVPRDGLYLVSSSLMAVNGKHLHCHMWKNGQSNVGAFGTNWSQGTLNTVMNLTTGDKLTIRHDNASGEEVFGSHWSMFSAYLITE